VTRKPLGRAGQKKTGDIEWTGGTVSMPAYVTGEGEPFRPEVLFWMGADGALLGSTLAKPGELIALASESLQSTIEQPMYGPPHAPTRVRVASSELANALRAGHAGLEVICAPTPELDEVLASLCETMTVNRATEQSYLSPEIGPDAVASFFESAAAMFRSKPWDVLREDQSVLSVTIAQLGVRDAAMSVIGQMGQSFGFILFSNLDDFEAYLHAADTITRGEQPVMPPHFALTFERGAELDPALRKEIEEHHWEVAAPNAYPGLLAIDEELVVRPSTPKDVTMAEAIARALTKMLAAAWDDGEPVSRTLSVNTHQGEIEVTLGVPYQHAPIPVQSAQPSSKKVAKTKVAKTKNNKPKSKRETRRKNK